MNTKITKRVLKAMNRFVSILIFLFLVTFKLPSQSILSENQLDSLSQNYKVAIQNSEGLQTFFTKLNALEKGLIDRVNIVHIGDSHLQAGFLTNEARKQLQLKFGNAGQGLVFPYKLANSNSPRDSYSYSNVEWESFRNVHEQDQYQIGVKGYVVATPDSTAILKISVNPKDSLDYSFDKITLFQPDASAHSYNLSQHSNRDILEVSVQDYKKITYKVRRGDYLGKIASKFSTSVIQLKRLNKLRSDRIYANQKLIVKKKERHSKPIDKSLFEHLPFTKTNHKYSSEIVLDSLVDYVLFNQISASKTQPFQVDGMILEKQNEKGVLYHMIGVNGAMYTDYNTTELFFKQLPALKPDIIIVSLGTNEISNKRNEIIEDMQLFFNNLSKVIPNETSILITTPIDHRKRQNLSSSVVKNILKFSQSNNLSHIDFYNVFGGKGSMRKLQHKNFAQRDGIHLNAKGYKLQGFLLAKALLETYNTYTFD